MMVVSLSFSIIVVCTCLSKLIHLYTYVGTVPHVALILFLPSVLVPDILIICLSRLFLSRKRTTITYISRLLGCTFSYVVNVYNCLLLNAYEQPGSSCSSQQLSMQHSITRLAPRLRGQMHRDMFTIRMASDFCSVDPIPLSSV